MCNEKPEGREIKEGLNMRETWTCVDIARHTRGRPHHSETRRERRGVCDSGAQKKERVRVSCSTAPVVKEDAGVHQGDGDLMGQESRGPYSGAEEPNRNTTSEKAKCM